MTAATWPAVERRVVLPLLALLLAVAVASTACPRAEALAAVVLPGEEMLLSREATSPAATATTRGEVGGAAAGDPPRSARSAGERRAGFHRVAGLPKGVGVHAEV